jgi:hypothetical protein
VSNYLLGVLYGDGSFQNTSGYEWFFFASTHKELSDKVKIFLKENNINHFSFIRDFASDHIKANYELLEVIEITDKEFNKYLIDCGFKSEIASERIKWNPDFLRGYLETKGTMFTYLSRGNEAWRIAFSGNEKDVSFLAEKLENDLEISVSKMLRRRERERLGIISESYRISLQNRNGIANFVSYIDSEEITEYLREKIEAFKKWHRETPFNMKRVFKHYKYAVAFMCKGLGIQVKGARGGGGGKHWKPIYVWIDGEQTDQFFKSWEDAYNWVKKEYLDKTGFNPPFVEEV